MEKSKLAQYSEDRKSSGSSHKGKKIGLFTEVEMNACLDKIQYYEQ